VEAVLPGRAVPLRERRNIETALGYLDTSIGIKSNWSNNWWRAQALAKKGRMADAVAAGEKTLQVGAGNETLREVLQGGRPEDGRRLEEGQVLIQGGIFEAYTAGDAGTFFEGHFAQDRSWERARRAARPLSPDLAFVLDSQNARYAPSPARDANLRALRAGAGAVVTGQQTGSSSGHSTRCTRPRRRSGCRDGSPRGGRRRWCRCSGFRRRPRCAEIAVCHVSRGSDEPLTLSVEVASDGVSVAHRVLPAAVETLLATLGGELARFPHGEEHVACLARHYRPGAGWGIAFAGMLAELFAAEGLVLLDPRDPALAPSPPPFIDAP